VPPPPHFFWAYAANPDKLLKYLRNVKLLGLDFREEFDAMRFSSRRWPLAPAILASWAAFSAVFFSYSSCTTKGDKTDAAATLKLTPEESKKLDEFRAEVEIGRNMAGRLLAFYGTNGDDKLRGYINQVGSYVSSYSDYPERKYMFAILDTEAINAFACPGGYILLTQGVIRQAQSESELAMILGHEVAHVGKQHMFNTLKVMDKAEAEKAAKEGEKATEVPASVAMRKRPEPEEIAEVSKFAKILGSSGMAGIGILQAAKAGMSLILEKGLDQKLEFEADQEGVKYAVRAGYDPKAMLNFLDRLSDKKKKVDTKTLGKTHPKIEDREDRIKELLVALKANDIVGATGKARFKKVQARLPAI